VRDDFAATKGTIFYRLKHEAQLVMIVLTLLAYGCPRKRLWRLMGWMSERSKLVATGRRALPAGPRSHRRSEQLDLQQVQADEIKAKIQGGTVWLALVLMVSTRLWLGGAISPHRDKALIQTVADQVRRSPCVDRCCWQSMACPAMSRPSAERFGRRCRGWVSPVGAICGRGRR